MNENTKAQQLADKWIEEEQRLREKSRNAYGDGEHIWARADQLHLCRRDLQEMFGLVRKV